MLMVCPYCASTNIITIKGQGFCVNCGHAVPKPGQTETAAAKSLPKIATISHFGDKARVKLPEQRAKAIPVTARVAVKPKSAPKQVKSISDITRQRPKPRLKLAAIAPAAVAPVVVVKPLPAPMTPAKPFVSPVLPVHDPNHVIRAAKTKRLHHQVKSDKKPRNHKTRIVLASNLLSAVLAGGFAVAVYLVIHKSAVATPGELFHFLATRSLHTRRLLGASLPAGAVAMGGAALAWLWLRASAIFASSKISDGRPVSARVARRSGFNSLGALSALIGVALVLVIAWTTGLIMAIRLISHLSLGNNQLAAIGVAVSFVMVLVGLWFAAILATCAYMVVLSGQKLSKCLGQSIKLASRNYAYTAGTALWLGLCLGAIGVAATAVFIILSLTRFGLPLWVIASASGVIVAIKIFWFSHYSLGHWSKRYRRSTQLSYGESKLALYWAGRHARPISKAGVSLSIIWWLVVAIGGSLLLWHAKVDPTNLFNKLSADIY